MPSGHITRKVAVVPTLLVALVALSMPLGCTTPVPGAPVSTGVSVASQRTALAQDAQNVALIQADLNDLELLKELQADGSYKVTGTATLTVDGKTQSHTWTKLIAADGTVTGTGTFTKADGTTKTVTFGGTEEQETSAVADAATGTVATVEASAETGADTAATVTDATTGP